MRNTVAQAARRRQVPRGTYERPATGLGHGSNWPEAAWKVLNLLGADRSGREGFRASELLRAARVSPLSSGPGSPKQGELAPRLPVGSTTDPSGQRWWCCFDRLDASRGSVAQSEAPEVLRRQQSGASVEIGAHGFEEQLPDPRAGTDAMGSGRCPGERKRPLSLQSDDQGLRSRSGLSDLRRDNRCSLRRCRCASESLVSPRRHCVGVSRFGGHRRLCPGADTFHVEHVEG